MAVGHSFGEDRTSSSLAEVWDGSAWSIVPTTDPVGASFTWLTDIACLDVAHCTAVGFAIVVSAGNQREVPIVQDWDGSSWTLRLLPAPRHAQHPNVLGVACTSSQACTAVGSFSRHGSHPLVERWDGMGWTIQSTPDLPGGRNAYLSSVACPQESACIAVGYKGGPNHSGTLVETWDGTAWRIQDSPNPPDAQGGTGLFDVACASSMACLAVGSYAGGPNGALMSMLAERWDGTTWSLTSPAVPKQAPVAELNGSSCVGDLTCVVVGFHAHLTGPYRTLAERS